MGNDEQISLYFLSMTASHIMLLSFLFFYEAWSFAEIFLCKDMEEQGIYIARK